MNPSLAPALHPTSPGVAHRAAGVPDSGEADGDRESGRDEIVAPGVVRQTRLMADGRRITYYQREQA